jgi:hypothetical protein
LLGEITEMPNASDNAILDDAVHIVNQAQEAGLTVRLLGALAVRVQAGAHADLFYQLDRLGSAGKTFTDIDLVAYSKQRSSLHKFLEDALRYRLDQYPDAWSRSNNTPSPRREILDRCLL